MKKNNYRQKVLAIIIFIVFVLCALVGYYEWENDQTNKKLEDMRNNYITIVEELNITQNELLVTQENLQIEIEKSLGLSTTIDEINKELETVNTTIADLKSEEYKLVYLGDYKITYYCDEEFEHICGYGNHMTASGKQTEVGWTAAADWGILPNGSIIYIEDIGFREVMDVGGAVNGEHIDVLVQEHEEALDLGVDYEGVWLLVKKTS